MNSYSSEPDRNHDDSAFEDGFSLQAPAGAGKISARSRSEAMDWALALVSQGLAPTVVCSPDRTQWAIWVDGRHETWARQIIDTFIRENQGWAAEPVVEVQEKLIHWGCLFWAVYLIAIFAVDFQKNRSLSELGMMNNEAVANGEWWRMVTAVSLHENLDHLTSNLISGTLLLGLAMARFGAGNAVFGGWLCGVLGNLVGYLLYDAGHRGLGASGMVFGLLGLLSTHSVLLLREHRKLRRHFFSSLFAAFLLFVLMGLSPETDILAHAGGFIGGCLLGILMTLEEKQFSPKAASNTVSLLIFLFSVAFTWWLALW